MAANLIPIPSPPPNSLFLQPHHYNTINTSWSHIPSHPLTKPLIRVKAKAKLPPLCSIPSPSSSAIEEEEEEEESSSSPLVSNQAGVSIEDADKLLIRGCKACGRERVENGCNGEGRIQGGIATVPGFGWWPIKAYRPCPGFVEVGGQYRRRGQSMDEVAWGRTERDPSTVSLQELQSSKNKQKSKQ